ncbi:hypothetical protein D3C71_1687050 [compost metagenome]
MQFVLRRSHWHLRCRQCDDFHCGVKAGVTNQALHRCFQCIRVPISVHHNDPDNRPTLVRLQTLLYQMTLQGVWHALGQPVVHRQRLGLVTQMLKHLLTPALDFFAA